GDEIEHHADQLVDQERLLAHHRSAIARCLETSANLVTAGGQRCPQRCNERAAIECAGLDRTRNGRQLLLEHAPIDDIALSWDAGHNVPPPLISNFLPGYLPVTEALRRDICC